MTRTIQHDTFIPDRRKRIADKVADETNPFRRNGYYDLPTLHHDGVAPIRAHFWGHQTRLDGGQRHFDTERVLACETLRRMATGIQTQWVIASHLGTAPHIADVSVWLSDPDMPDATHKFHRDYDDWRACKLFIYLTDVETDDDGPHQFIVGSHRIENFENSGVAPDPFFFGSGRELEEVQTVLNGTPAMTVYGSAGRCWLEQTYGFHRALPVKRGQRMIAQVCYTMTEIQEPKSAMIRKAWGCA